MEVRAKAQSSNTSHPIWVEGEYITKPPVRPKDKVQRPEGHYIDKGGYPGANVYEVSIDTLCRWTEKKDRTGKAVYEKDILLYEVNEEDISYFIVEDTEQAIDIISGEIVEMQKMAESDIKVIGNVVVSEDFIEGIRHYVDRGLEVPYVPNLNVQVSAYPYFMFECEKCKNRALACMYKARCSKCGGFLMIDYSSKMEREKASVQ